MMQRRWRVQGILGDVWIALHRGAVGSHAIAPRAAARRVSEWFAHHQTGGVARAQLREIAWALGERDIDRAADVVAQALRDGRLVAEPAAFRQPHAPPTDLDASADDLARDVASRQKTWIEVELTDMDGKPMPGERYWIKLPDGAVREGNLDRLGRVYVGGLDPGSCEIRWPDRDGDAVELAPKLGQRPLHGRAADEPEGDADELTWIEIELLDMDGNPVAGEPYWVQLPDGTVREGHLDDEGRAYFDQLTPGTAIIRWPERDGEATATERDLTASPGGRADVDLEAQVEALEQAAEEGAPFCEECERARRELEERRAAGGDEEAESEAGGEAA